MHISIPEIENIGLNIEEAYNIHSLLVKNTITNLRTHYPSQDINNIIEYPICIAERIIKMSRTLLSVIKRDNDYITANTILRNISDSVASFDLIYMEPDDDLKELRHYLYIIDGPKTRIDILDVNHDYDGKISRREYDQLVGQINRAVENYKGAVDLCVNIIRNLEVYKSHPDHVEKLIKTGNWKFKSVINPKDRYTWKELYDHLGLSDKTPIYISSLSEYVHGLSTSNLSIPNDTDTYLSIYAFGMILIERLHKNLLNTYGEEFAKENFRNLLINPEIPIHYIKHIINKLSQKDIP